MAFQIEGLRAAPNPPTAGSPFRIWYQVRNVGPGDDFGHQDHVEMWGSDGSKPVDHVENIQFTTLDGGMYGVFVDVPPQPAGYYDVSLKLPDGTSTGTTVIVQ